MTRDRLDREEAFHDHWAASVRPEDVLVRQSFEAPTAPEHRHILRLLGDLTNRRVLDLGCGLGEAAVYFALKGAVVTASDLSPGMLDVVARVATLHGVTVTCQCAPAERTGLPPDAFDVVYAGNVLHHTDTAAVLDEARRVLTPGGLFVSWDPLAHNPLINVYRRMARAVRTEDEHPLRISDLALFRERFTNVQYQTFWLTTLAVFLRFYLIERVHPSSERYWKKILTDADRLAPFHAKLERWDERIFQWAPWLGRYCWNIVVWGNK
jgi:SAM-dependent methyltransferase